MNRGAQLQPSPSCQSPSSSLASLDAEEDSVDRTEDTDEEEERVMSEIHLGCPPGVHGPHLTNFTIYIPHGQLQERKESIGLDEDGDLVLPRRTTCAELSTHRYRVRIQHNITSSIPRVGLQVWKAELVLSDFVLHKMLNTSELHSVIALELGAGTGLAGIMLAQVARTVFLTDCGDEILNNCAKNIQLNSRLLHSSVAVHVRELDWFSPWPPGLKEHSSENRYSWTAAEIEEAQEASVLLAADVIYSDDLTDALFSLLQTLMSTGSSKVLYLALEKRYNFSLSDFDVVANGYSHFCSYLKDERDIESLQCASMPYFVGKQIDIVKIPKYVSEYDRGADIEIWQIQYHLPGPSPYTDNVPAYKGSKAVNEPNTVFGQFHQESPRLQK